MRKILLRPKAKHDLREIIEYLADKDTTVSTRFTEVVEKALTLLAEMPDAAPRYRSETVQNVRRQVVGDFRYLLFYSYTTEAIEVIRVLHQARDVEDLL